MWTRIRFLGCYDTVAALGLPSKTASAVLDGLPGFRHKFHDFHLSESVENACQALAIDDERKTFHPVPWEKKALDYQAIKQVWFCGMHTDVGGGYKKQGLAGIPLVWMTQQAVEQGLKIYSGHKVLIKEAADGHMHDSREGVASIYRKKQRQWDSARLGKPVIHESVLQRKLNQDNKESPAYRPWILDLEYDIEPWVRHEQQPWFVDNKP